MPACRIAASPAAASPRRPPPRSAWWASRRAQAATRSICASIRAIAPYDELQPKIASHRNGDVAARIVVRFEEAFESLKLQRRILHRLPAGPIAASVCTPPDGSVRHRLDRRLARRGVRRPGSRAGRRDPPLPPARSLVAELAGARARDHRQHRSGLPAGQQVVQPVLRRAGPLTMYQLLKQIVKVGIKTEAPPLADESMRVLAGRLNDGSAAPARARAHHPARRSRLVQRLRARDPRAEQSLLQPGGPGHQVRRQSAPRGHAAGHRTGGEEHGTSAAPDLRRDPRTEAGGGDRRLRLQRRGVRRELRLPRRRCQRAAGRRHGARLPADADRDHAGHPHRDQREGRRAKA